MRDTPGPINYRTIYHDYHLILMFQNVATYGGLCALATFERSELHKQVITSSTFKLFLELDPQLREVRRKI